MPFARRRPPWWPAEEPWPPRGGPGGAGPWPYGPRPFMRRLGCFFAVFALFAFAGMVALVSTVVGWLAGGGEQRGPHGWVIALLAIAALLGLLRLLPSLRRFAG